MMKPYIKGIQRWIYEHIHPDTSIIVYKRTTLILGHWKFGMINPPYFLGSGFIMVNYSDSSHIAICYIHPLTMV